MTQPTFYYSKEMTVGHEEPTKLEEVEGLGSEEAIHEEEEGETRSDERKKHGEISDATAAKAARPATETKEKEEES